MYYWLLVIILKCIIPKYSFHCVYANEIYGLDVSIYMLSTVLNILLQGVDVYIPCNISMEFRTCLKPSRTHLFMHTQTHTLSETNHPEKRIAFGWNICIDMYDVHILLDGKKYWVERYYEPPLCILLACARDRDRFRHLGGIVYRRHLWSYSVAIIIPVFNASSPRARSPPPWYCFGAHIHTY